MAGGATTATGGKAGELLSSLYRFGCSMSLFGAQQVGELLATAATLRPPDEVTEAFDAVAETVESELGAGLRRLSRSGERFARAPLEVAVKSVEPAVETGRSLASTAFLRGSLEVLEETAGIVEAALPRRLGHAWRELGNKATAFRDFQYAHQVLGLVKDSDMKLGRAVEKAREQGLYRYLWLMEGLGYIRAEAAWRSDGRPSGLLADRVLATVPERSWLPLHTGMGLALARRELPKLGSGRSAGERGDALRRFRELCDENSHPTLRPAVFEALGLVVRNLDPAASSDIDGCLEGDERELFWHGTGRGLYFVASHSYPGALARAFAKARDEAPDALARKNAVAGLAWAFTLVNFRHPGVVSAFVEHETPGWSAADEEALSHGVSSAATLWLAAAGGDLEEPALEAFCSHKSGDERWRRLVLDPTAAALANYPRLRKVEGMGRLFRTGPGSEESRGGKGGSS